MKVLHLSFHYGCISDIDTVFKSLGHDITHIFCRDLIPYHITEQVAKDIWNKNHEYYNGFDIIVTSDTVALSFIFLLNIDKMKPHLIILNCNRFNYAMTSEPKFKLLLQELYKKLDKITYIPYTDFERIWCGRHQIYLHERAVMPIGKYIQHINEQNHVKLNFKELETNHRIRDKRDTIFLQRYDNNYRFMNVSKFLYDRDISVDFGSYVNISELKDYLAVVVLPEQFSKYFTFETIQNDIVVIMPSPVFLSHLVKQPGYYFNIEGSSGQLTNDYISLCEWYKYPEARIYFESFDDLVNIIKTLTPEKLEDKRKWCRFYSKAIVDEHLLQWKNILDKIQIKRSC